MDARLRRFDRVYPYKKSVFPLAIFMSRRRKKPRGFPVNGVLLLDKPAGLTSNGALQEAKQMLYAQKAGHTGSLDPLATGLLPLCFGEATKMSQYLLGSRKSYRVTIQLGTITDSGDADGEVLETREVKVNEAQVAKAVASFEGETEQMPPMFSAIKVNGTPLYKLARQGKEIEREPRQVTAYRIALLSFSGNEIELDLDCSSGYYVRSLAVDIGEKLGCGAHVCALRRTAVADLSVENAITLEQLQAIGSPKDRESVLIDVSAALTHLPRVDLSANIASYFLQGEAVKLPQIITEDEITPVRVFSDTGQFIGLGDAGKVRVKLVRAFS